MNTRQNYGAQGAQPNPIVPTAATTTAAAQPSPQTVDSDQPTAPNPRSSLTLSFGISDNAYRDSSALIMLRAVDAYKQTRQKQMLDYAAKGEKADAMGVLAEINEMDRILFEAIEQMQHMANEGLWLLTYQTNPGLYRDAMEREEEDAGRYEAEFDALVSSKANSAGK